MKFKTIKKVIAVIFLFSVAPIALATFYYMAGLSWWHVLLGVYRIELFSFIFALILVWAISSLDE